MTALQPSAILRSRFDRAMERFLATDAMRRVMTSSLTRAQYASILRETFHYARENPQMRASACTYLRGRERDLVGVLFKHAGAEVGHENLAMNDLEALGENVDALPYENPLPATTAMTAFAYYQIHRIHPGGYIGYGYFLEFLPATRGPEIMAAIAGAGIPNNAASFLHDHSDMDIAHIRLVDRYIDALCRSPKEVEIIGYAIETTAHLYASVLQQAIAYADAPYERGWNWLELEADGVTPETLTARAGGRPAGLSIVS